MQYGDQKTELLIPDYESKLVKKLKKLIKKGKIKEFQVELQASSLRDLDVEYKAGFCLSLVKALIQKDVNDAKDFNEEHCIELIKLCLERGDNIDLASRNLKKDIEYSISKPKKTLLMLAVEHNFQKIVDFIIEQPKINYRDKRFEHSLDALDYAAICGHKEIFKKLYKKALAVEMQEDDEKIAKIYKLLDLAIVANNVNIVNILKGDLPRDHSDMKFFFAHQIDFHCILALNYAQKLVHKLDLLRLKQSEPKLHLALDLPSFHHAEENLRKDFLLIKSCHEEKIKLFQSFPISRDVEQDHVPFIDHVTKYIRDVEEMFEYS